MRRLLTIPLAAFSAVGVLAVPSAALGAVTERCTVTDANITDMTGIVAVEGGYVVLNKRQNGPLRLYKLDEACKAQRMLSDSAIEMFSAQDLSRTSDGSFWIADIGDIDSKRDFIVIDKVAPNATKGTKYRLKYPDGPHNAAAMIMQASGAPLIFTWENGPSKMYTSAGPLKPGSAPNVLQAAGLLTIPESRTDGGTLGPLSRKVVSGAALSPDGKKIVLRTLTDAYEWDVTGDVAAALKSGKKPRITPLPNEADGQSITYTTDGAGYITASAGAGSKLLEWPPAPLPEPSAAKASAAAGTAPATDDSSLLGDLSLSQLNGLILGAGLAGLLMLIGGVVGIVRFRRKAATEEEPSLQDRLAEARRSNANGVPQDQWGDSDHPAPVGQETVALGHGRDANPAGATTLFAPATDQGRGTVYGGNPSGQQRESRPSTVYGAPATPAPEPQGGRGTVYGGNTYGTPPPPPVPPPSAPARGTTYGSPPQASASPPRPSQVASPRSGAIYGGQQQGAGNVYGGQPGAGNVYGGAATPPEPYRPQAAPVGRPVQPPPSGGAVYGRPADPSLAQDGPEPARPTRDWRSRRPPE